MKLDKTNCKILNLLQEDCRMSYTEISKKVGLSVDSVKKRIDSMLKQGFFFPQIQIRPRRIGFQYVVDIKIKLHNYNDKELKQFIEYLSNHHRVAELFSISGQWDFTVVILAKDHEDLAAVTEGIRKTFSKMINDWSESITTVAYKFEKYDMLKILEDLKNEKA